MGYPPDGHGKCVAPQELFRGIDDQYGVGAQLLLERRVAGKVMNAEFHTVDNGMAAVAWCPEHRRRGAQHFPDTLMRVAQRGRVEEHIEIDCRSLRHVIRFPKVR